MRQSPEEKHISYYNAAIAFALCLSGYWTFSLIILIMKLMCRSNWSFERLEYAAIFKLEGERSYTKKAAQMNGRPFLVYPKRGSCLEFPVYSHECCTSAKIVSTNQWNVTTTCRYTC